MISAAGLEVDQAKVSIIRNLMPPTVSNSALGLLYGQGILTIYENLLL